MALATISTTAGAVREVNEDSVCVKVASSRFGEVVMAVVCDGVGGLSAGEIASASVATAFSRWFEEHVGAYLVEHATGSGRTAKVDLEGMRVEWGQLLLSMNEAIYRYGNERNVTLGTTLSAMLICGQQYFTAQVGDTRIYLLRNERATKITTDQTYVAREVAQGRMTAEEAENHPKRNVLLQAIGAQDMLTPEYSVGAVEVGDVFIACTDGFYHNASPEVLASQLLPAVRGGEASAQQALDCLVQGAMDAGETDNISAVLVSGLNGQMPDDSTTTLLGATPQSSGPDRSFDDEETGTLSSSMPEVAPGSPTPNSSRQVFDDARTSRLANAPVFDDETTDYLQPLSSDIPDSMVVAPDDGATAMLDSVTAIPEAPTYGDDVVTMALGDQPTGDLEGGDL